MGLGIVLIVWAVFGTVVATVSGGALAGITAWVTRGATGGRWIVIIAAGAFPLICFGWAGAVVVVQGIVSETMLGRDFGLGDSWYSPLPNGYKILMIDVTDQGWVYNAKTQPESSIIEREDAVPGVRTVQVAMPYILGATDSKSFENLAQEVKDVDGYFILDTRTGKRTSFRRYEAFQERARAIGVDLKLLPIHEVYFKFRFNWFDGFVLLLLFVPLLTVLVLLISWIVIVRRARVLRSGMVPTR